MEPKDFEYFQYYDKEEVEKMGSDSLLPKSLIIKYNGLRNEDYDFVNKNDYFIKKYDYFIDNCCIHEEPFHNGVTFVVKNYESEWDFPPYALMDISGNLLTEFFDGIGECWVDNNFIAVNKNRKYGFIDKWGNQITDFIYDEAGYDIEWMCNGVNYEIVRNFVDGKELLGLFTFQGKVVLEPNYKSIEIDTSYKFFSNQIERNSAIINDVILLEDFEGNKFKWTHLHGLEAIS